jgi:anti-anti-sigma factor
VDISIQEYKRVAVITVKGRIDSTTSEELDMAMKGLVEKGHHNLALDLASVDFLSSSGLRVMVNTLKLVHQVGGELVLAQPAEQAAESIAIAGRDALLKTNPPRQTAIASF